MPKYRKKQIPGGEYVWERIFSEHRDVPSRPARQQLPTTYISEKQKRWKRVNLFRLKTVRSFLKTFELDQCFLNLPYSELLYPPRMFKQNIEYELDKRSLLRPFIAFEKYT